MVIIVVVVVVLQYSQFIVNVNCFQWRTWNTTTLLHWGTCCFGMSPLLLLSPLPSCLHFHLWC